MISVLGIPSGYSFVEVEGRWIVTEMLSGSGDEVLLCSFGVPLTYGVVCGSVCVQDDGCKREALESVKAVYLEQFPT